MPYIISKPGLVSNSADVISFWKHNFTDWPQTKFEWYYQSNPSGLADCWLIAEQSSNTVVGVSAVFPRKVYVNGKPYRAGIAGDFAVDQRHRILGPALQLQKELVRYCKNSEYSFVYGYPNRNSEAVATRAGYQRLGSTHRMVRILKTERHLSKYVGQSVVSHTLGKLLDGLLRIAARESRQSFNKQYRFENAKVADDRFDELWQRSKSNYPLIGERSTSFLRWRLDQCPHTHYSYYLVSDKSTDQLMGYLVYYIRDNIVHIADAFCENLKLLENALLPSFLRYIRRSKFDSVSVMFAGQPKVLDIFRNYHFVPRPNNRNLIITTAGTDETAIVTDIDQWYFFEVDND